MNLFFAALAMIYYSILPLAYLNTIEFIDGHSVATVRKPCTNCPVEFDRVYYRKDANKSTLVTWSGQNYTVEGKRPGRSAVVSVRGVFLNRSTIRIDELHEHHGFNRDFPSYLGLILILFVWIRSFRHKRSRT